MAVTNTSAASGPYVGDGMATTFPFGFAAKTSEEVGVRVDGYEVLTGYTVTLDPTDYQGGSVTFSIAPAVGALVEPFSNPDFSETAAILDASGPALREALKNSLERGAIRDIALREELRRTMPGPPGPTGDGVSTLSTMANIAAIAGDANILTEAGRAGTFVYQLGDFRARVTADPLQGIYVPLATDPSGSAGAWVRQFTGPVSVKWFGAKGDGTANDTAAINAALAAVFSTRQPVYFPAGTYLYDGGGVLGLGVVVMGAGRNATTIKSRLASPTADFLFNASDYSAGLRNIRFEAAVAQTAGSYVWLSSTETFIEDFYMTGDFNGVLMTGSVARIRHGRFQDAATGGIRIRAEGGDCSQVIDDVLMGAQSPANIATAGIRLRNSGALMISNTSVIQQGVGLLIDPTTNTPGTFTVNTANGSVFALYASNCFFDNNTAALKIAPTGTAVVERCRFANCWFSSSSADGVNLNGSSITGIEFVSCHGLLNGGSGLTTGLGLTSVSVIGGTWGGNSHGFYFNNGFSGLRVLGATIGQGGGAGVPANTNNGIALIGAGFDNYVITGNTLVGNGTAISATAPGGSGFIFGNAGGNLTRFPDDLSLDASKVLKIGGLQVVGARLTGWTAGTGTANKGAFATYAGQTVSATYSQTQVQAIDAAVVTNSQRLKAVEDALRTHGLIN